MKYLPKEWVAAGCRHQLRLGGKVAPGCTPWLLQAPSSSCSCPCSCCTDTGMGKKTSAERVFFFFFPELYRFCSKPDTICKIWVWSNLEQNQKVSSPLENPKLPPALQLLSRIAASVDPSTANELLEHRAPKTSFSQTRPARNTCPVTLRQHFQGPQP